MKQSSLRGNTHQETDYVSYRIKNVVNRNMDRFLVQNMDKIKVKITTTKKKYFQFHIACICYSCLLINRPMRNSVLYLQMIFSAKTMSNMEVLSKFQCQGFYQ